MMEHWTKKLHHTSYNDIFDADRLALKIYNFRVAVAVNCVNYKYSKKYMPTA
jgi:hypothetical protein